MFHQLDDDRPKDECGVFGIYGHEDAAAITTLGLHALQHRGQESAGIVTFDKNHFHAERRIGLVSEHFTKQSVIDRLSGNTAIGHVRYSTTGGTVLRNVQPLFADLTVGGFAIAHNGNLTNAITLRKKLVEAIESETLVEFTFRDDSGGTRNYYVDVTSAQGLEFTGRDERGSTMISVVEP